MRALGVAAACALAGTIAVVPTAEAVFPGSDGVIAYTGPYEDSVQTIRPDGSHRERLLRNAVQPTWSADGRRIAFVRSFKNTSEIFVAKANGSGVRRVTKIDSDVADPAFSPDGDRIAFSSDADGDSDIYTIKTNGKQLRKVVDLPTDDSGPSWSVTSEIVFESRAGTTDSILRVDAAGAAAPVPLGPGDDPSWSPDGQTIVFVEGSNLLSTMDRSGAGRAPVSLSPPPSGFIDDPTFSPSGASIAIGRWSGSSVERFGSLLRVDLATGAVSTLAEVRYVLGDVGPDWRAGKPTKAARATTAETRTGLRAKRFCNDTSNCVKSYVAFCRQMPGPQIICRGVAILNYGSGGDGDQGRCVARFVWQRQPNGSLALASKPDWDCF